MINDKRKLEICQRKNNELSKLVEELKKENHALRTELDNAAAARAMYEGYKLKVEQLDELAGRYRNLIDELEQLRNRSGKEIKMVISQIMKMRR